jgi:lipid II:glycine glycyltransferase (peptidoglycan interpeptide bridge formation enzyme)
MSDATWQVEVDGVTADQWSQLLDLFDDANIYQTWSYGAVRWGEKNLSHLVLKKNGTVAGMAQLRIVRPTNLKFGIAYLRWGPLCHRRGEWLNSDALRRVARALEEEYVGKRRLLLKILPNAFAGSTRGETFQSAFSSFRQEGSSGGNTYRTFRLDLTPSLADLRRNLDKKWRNQLNRAEKNGLRVIAGESKDDFRTFRRMYRQMRSRKTFESAVNVNEFEDIQDRLPTSHRMRILICMQDGLPVAGLVASAMGDSAIYLLGATSDDGLNAKGSYVLQWSLIQWLKETRIRWYDLGGVDPKQNPGVYHFKAGLSGEDVSQLLPVIACNSIFSSALVRAGMVAQRFARNLATLQNIGRALKPTVS